MKKRTLAIVGFFVLIVIVAVSSQRSGSGSSGSAAADVWAKTSGYTVDDCNAVCAGTYNIQAQIDVCQGSCSVYGQPSEALDRYVNGVKNVKNNK